MFKKLPHYAVMLFSCCHVRLFAASWIVQHYALLSSTISWSLPKFMSIKSVMPSNHLTLCHCLLLLPSVFSTIRVFSNDSALHIRWPQYQSFRFSTNPSNEYSGLISFRIDWFYLLAVQGTLNSFLQHQSSKASILQCSTFFMVQLSHLYMTTGKIVSLTIWTFVGKVISLPLNTLSRFVIAFLSMSKCLHRIHRQKKRNSMIISMSSGKTHDKIQHPFIAKQIQKGTN